jgi:ABC-2 type transport system ATP-binding protein
VIEVEHLVKDYGTVVAVRDVSFQVGKGEVVGFLGPNGAGKSTTLRIVAGFLGATSGTVRVNGFDIASQSLEARASMGYMPEAAPLYPELRVREYLAFRARLKRVPRAERSAAAARAMELSATADVADTVIGHLSKGYRQRVALADALLGKPPLLILDEPTAGLDPNQIREVRRVIRELRERHTILLSTHILSEVESTCDRALVISRGKLIAQGTLDELRARRESRVARLIVRDPDDRAAGALPAEIERRAAPAGELTRLDLTFPETAGELGTQIESAVAALVAAGVGIRELTVQKATLEEVFAELTRSEAKHHSQAS